jgi:hypothetical protein
MARPSNWNHLGGTPKVGTTSGVPRRLEGRRFWGGWAGNSSLSLLRRSLSSACGSVWRVAEQTARRLLPPRLFRRDQGGGLRAQQGRLHRAGHSARGARSSIASIDLSHASSSESWISPRYSTWHCTTGPPLTRRFSTTLKVRCSLPSFRRIFARRNMTADNYPHIPDQENSLGRHYRRFAS